MKTLSLGSFGRITFPTTQKTSTVKGGAIPLPSAAEMAALDQRTIRDGTSSLELMERAGRAVADVVGSFAPSGSGIVVLCGPGNNGGDGIVVSRLLVDKGFDVSTVVVKSSRYSDDMRAQLDRYTDVSFFGDGALSESDVRQRLSRATVVVDALLGTGSRAAPRGEIRQLVELVASERPRSVVAVDVPTGVDTDTGALHTPHIQADLTITIQFVKRGCLQFPARAACGDIVVSHIGIGLTEPVEFKAAEEDNLPEFPSRAPDAHKGSVGHVLVMAGSASMPGAAILSCLGALRTGIGLVTRVCGKAWAVSASAPWEVITKFVETTEGSFDGLVADYLFSGTPSVASRADALVIGPGLSLSEQSSQFVQRVLEQLGRSPLPTVMDADALTILADLNGAGPQLVKGKHVVMTPHPGEAARLLGVSTKDVQADRFAAVRELSEKYGCTVVLKGAGTLVYGDGEGWVVPRGSPFMATAGSGDVLSGVLGALLARGVSVTSAALLGTYVHARAGECAAEANGGPITASDIARYLPPIVGALEKCS